MFIKTNIQTTEQPNEKLLSPSGKIPMNLHKISLFLLMLIWGLASPTGIIYGLYFILFFLSLFFLFYKRVKIPIGTIEDYIPFLFFLVWLYGFVIGIIRGNNIRYVIANFGGMFCYLGYYIFSVFKIKKEELSRVILFSGFLVCIFALLRLLKFIFGINHSFLNLFLGEDVGLASTGQLRVYFSTLTVGYGLLGASFLVSILNYKSTIKWLNRYGFLLLVLSVTSILFVAASKGFLLGGLFVLFYVYFVYTLKSTVSLKINKSVLFIIGFLFLLLFFMYYFDYISILELMFDSSDSSNNTRYDQLYYLLEDCSFWGNGLGATVPGLLRAEEAPYGVELTYINLIHKFGIFSLILFSGWLYMGYKLTILIYKRKSVFESVLALSCLGYLFPSIGNPLLMHPSMVLLNCASIYLLKYAKYAK